MAPIPLSSSLSPSPPSPSIVPPTLLLLPPLLAIVLLVHIFRSRPLGTRKSRKHLLAAYVIISFIGVLSALAGGLGIAATRRENGADAFAKGAGVFEALLQTGMGMSVIYLLAQSAPQDILASRRWRAFGVILSILLICETTTSLLAPFLSTSRTLQILAPALGLAFNTLTLPPLFFSFARIYREGANEKSPTSLTYTPSVISESATSANESSNTCVGTPEKPKFQSPLATPTLRPWPLPVFPDTPKQEKPHNLPRGMVWDSQSSTESTGALSRLAQSDSGKGKAGVQVSTMLSAAQGCAIGAGVLSLVLNTSTGRSDIVLTVVRSVFTLFWAGGVLFAAWLRTRIVPCPFGPPIAYTPSLVSSGSASVSTCSPTRTPPKSFLHTPALALHLSLTRQASSAALANRASPSSPSSQSFSPHSHPSTHVSYSVQSPLLIPQSPHARTRTTSDTGSDFQTLRDPFAPPSSPSRRSIPPPAVPVLPRATIEAMATRSMSSLRSGALERLKADAGVPARPQCPSRPEEDRRLGDVDGLHDHELDAESANTGLGPLSVKPQYRFAAPRSVKAFKVPHSQPSPSESCPFTTTSVSGSMGTKARLAASKTRSASKILASAAAGAMPVNTVKKARKKVSARSLSSTNGNLAVRGADGLPERHRRRTGPDGRGSIHNRAGSTDQGFDPSEALLAQLLLRRLVEGAEEEMARRGA